VHYCKVVVVHVDFRLSIRPLIVREETMISEGLIRPTMMKNAGCFSLTSILFLRYRYHAGLCVIYVLIATTLRMKRTVRTTTGFTAKMESLYSCQETQ